jgi:hypothetical protein
MIPTLDPERDCDFSDDAQLSGTFLAMQPQQRRIWIYGRELPAADSTQEMLDGHLDAIVAWRDQDWTEYQEDRRNGRGPLFGPTKLMERFKERTFAVASDGH